MNVTTILTFLLFWLATPADLTVVSLPPRGSVDLALTPAGKAEFERSGTLSRVKIEIDRVQAAASLGAGLNTYVAWAVSPEGEFENLGELAVVDARVRFEGDTRFDQFALIVTAEPHYMVDLPSSAVAYRNQSPRDLRVRSLTVTAQVGNYDYSKLERSAGVALNIASQARTAFELARSEGADRLAEAELRLARVALDTMEEMLNRADPAEIILPPANEAIRRSHRAFVFAREAVVRNQIEVALAEAAGLNRDKQQLSAQLEDLTAQLAAASARIRGLETNVANVTRENGQVAEERTQALARIGAIERELEELRRKQESERPTSIRIPEEYLDPVNLTLTPAGREALAKIVTTAHLWNGPLRIEGSAKAIEAVQKFFAEAGLPADRITLIPS